MTSSGILTKSTFEAFLASILDSPSLLRQSFSSSTQQQGLPRPPQQSRSPRLCYDSGHGSLQPCLVWSKTRGRHRDRHSHATRLLPSSFTKVLWAGFIALPQQFIDMPQPVETAAAQGRCSMRPPLLPRPPWQSRAHNLSHGSGHVASRCTTAAGSGSRGPQAVCNQCSFHPP